MKKLWGKTLKNYKIKNTFTLNLTDEFDAENLYEPLKDICYNLKIETPIVLKKHINQMQEYGTTKFTSSDFIDYIDFDSLIIEYFEQP